MLTCRLHSWQNLPVESFNARNYLQVPRGVPSAARLAASPVGLLPSLGAETSAPVPFLPSNHRELEASGMLIAARLNISL